MAVGKKLNKEDMGVRGTQKGQRKGRKGSKKYAKEE